MTRSYRYRSTGTPALLGCVFLVFIFVAALTGLGWVFQTLWNLFAHDALGAPAISLGHGVAAVLLLWFVSLFVRGGSSRS